MKDRLFADLYTPQGEKLPEIPWNTYPRPRLQRDSFVCLNGKWNFAACPKRDIPQSFDREIMVPYAPESLLSGVHEVFPENYFLFYQKSFSLANDFNKGKVILHFGAVDQIAEVFLNGKFLGSHVGGYDAFWFDITEFIEQQNTVVLRVSDRLDEHILPYGKQRRKRGGMWYTPVSGIWQTVWLESVPDKFVKSLSVKTGANFAEITAEGVESGKITVQTPQGEISAELCGGKAKIELENPRLWCPEDPYLYDFVLQAGEDEVRSYFALRTLEIKTIDKKPRLCLNGKPYFFHGVLDQGYWSDGLFTPADEKGYERDILAMKDLGFNMLRKHIKIEPQQFYYDCDRLGMIVFQDIVNNGSYSFIRDTALATIGVKCLSDKNMHPNKKSRASFIEHMQKTVRQLKNHPCICYWTIFNEGWGQFCSDEMYRRLKMLDDTRFIDSTSGWFKQKESDVESEHVYFKPYRFVPSDKPVVLSEFGGYSYRPAGHVFNLKKDYGYKFFAERKKFEKELIELYLKEIVPAAEKGLCAAVYTQVSDVEDETNGLISYDRRVLKVDAEKMCMISQRLKKAVE